MEREIDEEWDDSYLRKENPGTLYDVVYNGVEMIAYKNIDGDWKIYNPMHENNEEIIKPDKINGKRMSKVLDVQVFRKRKEE